MPESEDNLRILHGSGTAAEIITTVYEQIQTPQEFRESVMLTAVAAAAKFGTTPWALLSDLREGAPAGDEWEEGLPDLLDSIALIQEARKELDEHSEAE